MLDASQLPLSVVNGLNREYAEAGRSLITWERLALVEDDFDEHDLYELPVKKTDSRSKAFIEEYGERCAEVDALPPNIIRDRVREAIMRYIPQTEWDRLKEVERIERESWESTIGSLMSKTGRGRQMSFAKSSPALIELLAKIGDRQRDVSYSCGVVGSDFVLAPGRITIIGAPPGTGKTALASQIVFDALVENPDLRLWIANCEMGIETLLRREIARVSGVGHKRILEATFTKEEHGRILEAAEGMVSTISRVHHMIPPFDCESLHKLILQPTPGILVVDYLQKFRYADREARTGVDEVISVLRGLALQGWAILAMSSTARQQGGRNGGHNHQTLSLSSFKEMRRNRVQCRRCLHPARRNRGPIEGPRYRLGLREEPQRIVAQDRAAILRRLHAV